MGVIYKATCQLNGRSYIGQTKQPFEKRKRKHEQAKDDYVFHLAIQKYGAENFNWEIIEKCPDEKLNEREIYWIAYYNTYAKGYNSTTGGDNAEALVNWIKSHKEESHQNALNGLKYAQAYWQEHKEEHDSQLAKAREKAIKACSRKVVCVELNLTFDSLAEAERWSQTDQNPNGRKCSHQHISKVCKGKRKSAGGYTWKYI